MFVKDKKIISTGKEGQWTEINRHPGKDPVLSG